MFRFFSSLPRVERRDFCRFCQRLVYPFSIMPAHPATLSCAEGVEANSIHTAEAPLSALVMMSIPTRKSAGDECILDVAAAYAPS